MAELRRARYIMDKYGLTYSQMAYLRRRGMPCIKTSKEWLYSEADFLLFMQREPFRNFLNDKTINK